MGFARASIEIPELTNVNMTNQRMKRTNLIGTAGLTTSMRFHGVLSGALFILTALSQSAGAAAGFDCSRPNLRGIEQAICDDPTLRDLDGELNSFFKEQRAVLSDSDFKSLLDDQRKWLLSRYRICAILFRWSAADWTAASDLTKQSGTQCLGGLYRDRIDSLKRQAEATKAAAADRPQPLNHPDVWGLDLLATFPEIYADPSKQLWAGRINVFEVDERVIIRVELIQPNNLSSECWNINFFAKTAERVSCDDKSKPRGKMLPNETMALALGNGKIISIVQADPYSPSTSQEKDESQEWICHDPIVNFLESGFPILRTFPLNRIWIINKIESPTGFDIGGSDCIHPTEIQKLYSIASANLGIFVRLSDGSILAWPATLRVGNQSITDIVRLDDTLHTNYRSSRLYTLDEAAYDSIKGRNIFEIQKSLLEKFDK